MAIDEGHRDARRLRGLDSKRDRAATAPVGGLRVALHVTSCGMSHGNAILEEVFITLAFDIILK
jgi:hypothetical protein